MFVRYRNRRPRWIYHGVAAGPILEPTNEVLLSVEADYRDLRSVHRLCLPQHLRTRPTTHT